jgi:hypothetical protein
LSCQTQGLVQFIFSPPARPRTSPAFTKRMPPRRRAKNALLYVYEDRCVKQNRKVRDVHDIPKKYTPTGMYLSN